MVTVEEIRAARQRIGEHAVPTPLILSEFLSSQLGLAVRLPADPQRGPAGEQHHHCGGRYHGPQRPLLARPPQPAFHRQHSGNTVGVDVGITHTLTLSNSEHVDMPALLSAGETQRKRRLQRQLARQQKGSKRRECTKRKATWILDTSRHMSTRTIDSNYWVC